MSIQYPVKANAPVVPVFRTCGSYVCVITDMDNLRVCILEASQHETKDQLYHRALDLVDIINAGLTQGE